LIVRHFASEALVHEAAPNGAGGEPASRKRRGARLSQHPVIDPSGQGDAFDGGFDERSHGLGVGLLIFAGNTPSLAQQNLRELKPRCGATRQIGLRGSDEV
jgi:hypothetical protein